MSDLLIMKPFNPLFFVGIILFAALAFLLIKIYKDKNLTIRKRLIVVIYTITFIIFVVYKIYLSMDAEFSALRISAGYTAFNWFEELPLNLCNLNILLIIIAVLLDSRILLGFCFFFGSMGALCALMIPEAEFMGFSILLPRMMGFYLTHYLLLLQTPLLAGLKIFRPKYSDIKPTFIALMVATMASTVLNLIFIKTSLGPSCNYFFSVDPGGIPPFEFFYKLIPIPGLYMVPIFSVFIPYMFILTGCFRISERNHCHK